MRNTLLVNGAARADLLAFYDGKISVEERAATLDKEIRFVPFPFACSLLGMGEDGHFASLFPDAANLERGLDVDNPDFCMPVTTEASPHPRLSLTLSAISRSASSRKARKPRMPVMT